MVMNLVILAIVLASFALGFRFADIRAEAMDRVRRRTLAETAPLPATGRRAVTILPARPRPQLCAAPPPRPAARTVTRKAMRKATRTTERRRTAGAMAAAVSAPHS